jgi:hypothetical protein
MLIFTGPQRILVHVACLVSTTDAQCDWIDPDLARGTAAA